MVEAYALLAIPFGYAISRFRKHKQGKWVLQSFLCFCILLNLFQTYQHDRGVLWSEAANKSYYWSVFGKTKLEYRNLVTFDMNEPQPRQLKPGPSLYLNDFEDPTIPNISDQVAHSGNYAYFLTKED